MSKKNPSKQSTDFENELLSFHAELAAVFGDVGKPLVTHDKQNAGDSQRAVYAPAPTHGGEGATAAGEAGLVLINAHIPNDIPTKKINPKNFMIEPDSPCWRIKVQDFGSGIVEVVAIKQFEKAKEYIDSFLRLPFHSLRGLVFKNPACRITTKPIPQDHIIIIVQGSL